MDKKTNVLMLGSSLTVKGGMTSVVEGFINYNFKGNNIYYIPTHIDANKLKKIVFFVVSLVKVIHYLLFKKISIIHMHLSERGSFIRKNIIFNLAKFFNKKVIVHMHGAEFKEFYYSCNDRKKLKIRRLLRESDKVLVLGQSWNEFVLEIDKDIKTKVMPNFVTLVDDKVSLKGNKINILFLAVLIRRKGIFDLIEAINYLLKEIKDYDIKVIVAGTGKEETEAKDRVNELGIGGNFDFKGWVGKKEKQKLLQESQIFVLPSYNEGLPVAILEAMSYGFPIISTSVGSIEDAVINGYNGIIIEPGDVLKLKESIKQLILNNEMWKQYSNNSKELVKNKYNANIYFSQIEELYNKINKGE